MQDWCSIEVHGHQEYGMEISLNEFFLSVANLVVSTSSLHLSVRNFRTSFRKNICTNRDNQSSQNPDYPPKQ